MATRFMSEWESETTVRYWAKEKGNEWVGSGAVVSRRKRMEMREIVRDGVVLAIFAQKNLPVIVSFEFLQNEEKNWVEYSSSNLWALYVVDWPNC